jgi:hypothetical protein
MVGLVVKLRNGPNPVNKTVKGASKLSMGFAVITLSASGYDNPAATKQVAAPASMATANPTKRMVKTSRHSVIPGIRSYSIVTTENEQIFSWAALPAWPLLLASCDAPERFRGGADWFLPHEHPCLAALALTMMCVIVELMGEHNLLAFNAFDGSYLLKRRIC